MGTAFAVQAMVGEGCSSLRTSQTTSQICVRVITTHRTAFTARATQQESSSRSVFWRYTYHVTITCLHATDVNTWLQIIKAPVNKDRQRSFRLRVWLSTGLQDAAYSGLLCSIQQSYFGCSQHLCRGKMLASVCVCEAS